MTVQEMTDAVLKPLKEHPMNFSTGENMKPSTFDDGDIVTLPVPSHSATSALHSLMRDWERDRVVDEDESETELMVLLSGMVGLSDSAGSDA